MFALVKISYFPFNLLSYILPDTETKKNKIYTKDEIKQWQIPPPFTYDHHNYFSKKLPLLATPGS